MVGFLLALIATVLVGVGARDQVLVAGIAARQDQRPAVLLMALACAAVAAAAAVWLASAFAPQLDPAARRMLAVLALGLAAIEMIVLKPRSAPNEPTESLGAFGLVLLALQLFDAARFLLFAIIVASVLPGAAGLGGALGGMAVVAIGWAGSDSITKLPLARIRRLLGLALLITALVLFFRFRP